jgi:starvation-inducible DNA-binding protein
MNDVTQGLNALLADYQVFYQKLRSYHWNVSGPMFFGLHEKFEGLYGDAATKVDELAERVLAVGGKPVSTLKEQISCARLQEDSTTPSAKDMVRNVQGDLERLNSSLREVAHQATESGDSATANLLEGFADGQEKTAWMLRAFLSS